MPIGSNCSLCLLVDSLYAFVLRTVSSLPWSASVFLRTRIPTSQVGGGAMDAQIQRCVRCPSAAGGESPAAAAGASSAASNAEGLVLEVVGTCGDAFAGGHDMDHLLARALQVDADVFMKGPCILAAFTFSSRPSAIEAPVGGDRRPSPRYTIRHGHDELHLPAVAVKVRICVSCGLASSWLAWHACNS